MVTAASIMAVYLVSAVVVTTLLVPQRELLPGGAAAHRALAYLAHGSPLADGAAAPASTHSLATVFGDLYDLSSAFILCLAGVSVTMGLQNLLPHYLNRLGMDVSWAGKSGVIMHLLNVIILLVTVVFRASPSLQQWAYATSVLVLLAGAALAMSKDLRRNAKPRRQTHLVDRSLRRRRRLLPGDDRSHGADQPLRPDDRAVLRRRDSHQLVRLALDSLHRAALRGLRIRRRSVAATVERTMPIGARRFSCRIARA